MCGIAGIATKGDKLNPGWIRGMMDIQRHRGPDDEGYLALDFNKRETVPLTGKDSAITGPSIDSYAGNAKFFLGHRRLSILDTSVLGHQPMTTPDGSLSIVFNGEIYNYIELREQLRVLGYSFRTDSDTEVLLAAYREWGENCLSHLDGMWAFVLFDQKQNRLFGARDRFGVKPLYYYHDSTYFVFASEIKAFAALPFIHLEMNPPAVFDFLAFRAFGLEEEGFFKSIFEIKPSQAFSYSLSTHEIRKWTYYELEVETRWERFSETKSKKYIENIRELVMESVRLRLRSDVPVGSALSGGIDSTSVVCAASRLLEQERASHGLKTKEESGQNVFTAGFPGNEIDESEWARVAAKAAGARFHLVQPEAGEFFKDIEALAYTQDTPYASPSIYAQYRVMKLAHEAGIKVLLDGQGADELFTGYTMYYPVFLYEMLTHGHFGSFSREWKEMNHAPMDKHSMSTQLFKQFRRAFVPYAFVRKHRMERSGFRLCIALPFWEEYKNRFDLIRSRDFKSLNKMLYEYFTTQKLGTLLKYEDRNSMAFSIEARTPFADYLKLIEYVFQVPGVYKIHNGWSKYLLREAMKGIIPEEIRLRTDKKGFFTPEALWLNALHEELKPYLTEGMEEFIDTKHIMSVLEKGIKHWDYDFVQMVWSIISFAAWKKVFLATKGLS